ncbi:hypothetical protein ALC57_05296, partial [Trachymyrmex cornetzi]
LLFQSFPNLFFPIHACPNNATTFPTLSFTCSSCPSPPPFFCNVESRYLDFPTSFIPFPFHFQSTLLLLPLPFLNLTIFVFSLYSSNPFLST